MGEVGGQPTNLSFSPKSEGCHLSIPAANATAER